MDHTEMETDRYINRYINKYKYDTHVHTAETSPCSRVEGAKIARLYKQAGYTGIVITDHYCAGVIDNLAYGSWKDSMDRFLRGYRNAREEGGKIGLTVLPGIEITFGESSNDYLVYGIDEDFLCMNPELHRLTIKTFSGIAHENGLKIYQAHPFRIGMSPASPHLLDGIEVYNGNPRHDSNNDKAFGFASKYGLKMISGSDFHRTEDLARGGVMLSVKPTDIHRFTEMLSEADISALIRTIP